MSEYEHGPRTTAEAHVALQRLINAAFRQPGSPAFTIPPDPRRDADCVLSDVIEERDRLRAALAALVRTLRKCDAGAWTDIACSEPATRRTHQATHLCDAHAALCEGTFEVPGAAAIRAAVALLTAAGVSVRDG